MKITVKKTGIVRGFLERVFAASGAKQNSMSQLWKYCCRMYCYGMLFLFINVFYLCFQHKK